MASCRKIYFRWSVGVVVIEVNVKQVSPMSIGRPICSHNQGLHKINPVLITSDINCIRVLMRQSSRNVCKFLCQSDHLNLIRGVISGKRGGVMMPNLTGGLFHINVIKT